MLQLERLPGVIICTRMGPVVHFEKQNYASCSDSLDCMCPDEARVPRQLVRNILDRFTVLRFIDNMIYLRAASLNVIIGIVGLTFSCDGSHCRKADEFMNRGPEFWSDGSVARCESAIQTG